MRLNSTNLQGNRGLVADSSGLVVDGVYDEERVHYVDGEPVRRGL
jgi:hypothetical protein